MKQSVIVRGLGKRFRRYNPNRPWTFQEWLVALVRGGWRKEYFWSLRDIDFSVDPGRAVGIVGANGAGKSTLLRLLAGIGRLDAGAIEVNGRLSGLLSLGAGFHSDLTGRENMIVSGVIAGLTRRAVTERLADILEFAELQHAVDAPLRTYSTGMQMRLAFSVAIHVQADILLIDEVLAVGDRAFQRKCLERIERMKRSGCTIIIVSHDTWSIGELCDEVIWLQEGRIRERGPAADILVHYTAAMQDLSRMRAQRETMRRTPVDHPALKTSRGTLLRVGENRFGSLEVRITDVQVLNRFGVPADSIPVGDSISLEIEYEAPKHPVRSPVFGVTILNEQGEAQLNANSASDGLILPEVKGAGVVRLEIETFNQGTGTFYLDVGIYQHDWAYAYDYHSRAHCLQVTGSATQSANQAPRVSWNHEALVSGRNSPVSR